jgi:ferrous iron transport protein A
MLPNDVLPLTMVTPGQTVKLLDICAERKLRRRLTELGLTTGTELRVMQDQGGPVLIAIRDTRLALGRRMAQRILVDFRQEMPE